MKLNQELMLAVSKCSTAEELMLLAEKNGLSLTSEEAQDFLNVNQYQELSEEDIDVISGGCDSSSDSDDEAEEISEEERKRILRKAYSGYVARIF